MAEIHAETIEVLLHSLCLRENVKVQGGLFLRHSLLLHAATQFEQAVGTTVEQE